jgi:diguanylate cyclase (GGDEF)-like protein
MVARISIVSAINGLLCALAAYELWRGRGEVLASRWPTLAAFVSFSVLMFARAAAAGVAPFPIGAQPLDPAWLGAFMWLVFGHATFAAVLFLAMTMERREAEQRSFAMSDPLTGLMNRRAFADFAARMSRRRAGIRSAMAILVLDLDHFKQVNDQFGHEVGDRMLRAFADVSESNVRPSDQLFRMGGEEFCFAMPETSLSEAIGIAERIRRAFEACSIEASNGPAAATVSIGIAATQYAVEVEVLLAAADAAVYEAKARGRNCVVVAEPASLGHRFRTEPLNATRRSA